MSTGLIRLTMAMALAVGAFAETLSAQSNQIRFVHDAPGTRLTATLTGTNAPTLTTVASNQTVRAGDIVAFNAVATGTGPVTYQWRLNGNNISGATNATLFLTSAVGSDGGAYSVVASNAGGSVTNHAGTLSVLITTNLLFAVAYGNGKYVTVGENGTLLTSSDRYAWSTNITGTSTNLYGVAFGNSTFVVVGSAGLVLTSADGTTWTNRNSGTVFALEAVTYGNGLFVAVGTAGTIVTSPDGVTWTVRTSGTPTLFGVNYANSLFVAVGTSGAVWTSPNGTSWTSRSSGTSATLTGATFGNGNFVVVGNSGVIVSSTDGTNWFSRSSGTTEALLAASFFNNTLFAVGPSGSNFISSDAINWGRTDSGTSDRLFGLAPVNGILLAVGEHGTIIEVPAPPLDHFVWNTISSPQRSGFAFVATITAKDAANNTVTNFAAITTLAATRLNSPATNMILGNQTYVGTNLATHTIGYSFTPNANLLVTHVRHYSGTKVSIWTDTGVLLASQNVISTPGTWLETQLPTPVQLTAGTSYRLGVYSGGTTYYGTFDGALTFSDGTIDQGYYVPGDAFPNLADSPRWLFVDLKYSVQATVSGTLSPTVSGTFTNGVWSGNLTVQDAGANVVLRATDTDGHTGVSNPFAVWQTNDMVITLTDSPDPATVGNNLTYVITVNNPGPTSATVVNVTNTLPASVTFVSATPSQGSCANSGGQVTCSLGTIGSLASATVTIVVTPTTAGVMLTNTVKVTRNEADADSANNSATAITQVLPTLVINDVSVVEGNIGTTNAVFTVTLSGASIQPVKVNYATADGTASAGSDYYATNGVLTFAPGTTNQTITVRVIGDVNTGGNETYFVNLSSPVNASLADAQGLGTIVNDDGLPGQVHHFDWNTVASPQRVNQSFSTTITAKDVSNNTATNFNGTVALSGTGDGSQTSNTILGDLAYTGTENNGTFTIGYAFVPSTNIIVTHVRHYSGSKVSIWTDGGVSLTSQNVDSVLASWVETPLTTPVQLLAGNRYRVAFYSGGNNYFWRTDGTNTFANGSLIQTYTAGGDAFPTNANPTRWFFVDLRYTVGTPVSISPSVSGTFTNGVWTGNVTVQQAANNMALAADDGNGHNGVGNVFTVLPSGDLAVKLTAGPNPVTVGSNLTYTITVMNSGPSSATGVNVTNTLPTDATFVSASTTQGTCTNSAGQVTCSLGTIGSLSAATVTIVVTPTIVGTPLTNTVSVTRGEADTDTSNNSATIVTTASFSLSMLVGSAVDASGFTWRTGGNGLWSNQTNITHDGVDAAQSGGITHSQQAWIEATMNGPGTISFWWRVSSETNADFLSFYANGVLQTRISGDTGWLQRSYLVPASTFVFRWTYSKDGSVSSGSDAAWVDQITFTVPPFSLSSPTALTNGQFQFTLVGTNGQKLVVQASTNLTTWLPIMTNTLSATQTNLMDTQATNYPYRFYRALFYP